MLLPLEEDVEVDEQTFSDEIIAAVDSGRKIEAIKRLREETGLSLKEAKDAIDALSVERQVDPVIAAAMSEEGGAVGLIKLLVIVAVIVAAYYYFFIS